MKDATTRVLQCKGMPETYIHDTNSKYQVVKRDQVKRTLFLNKPLMEQQES